MSKDYGCPKCGSMDVFIEEKGSQNGLYCSEGCGWIKWISKKDLPYVRKQIEENKMIIQPFTRTDLDKLKDYYEQKKFELEIENNAYNRGVVKGLEVAIKIMGTENI